MPVVVPLGKTPRLQWGNYRRRSKTAECETLGLESIVAKSKDAPYRSGKGDWIKVKTRAWREANRYRAEMFNAR